MKCVRVVGRKSTIGTWCGSQTRAGTNSASLVTSAASNSPIPATPGTRNSTVRLTTIGKRLLQRFRFYLRSKPPLPTQTLCITFRPDRDLNIHDSIFRRRSVHFFIARRHSFLYILRFYSRPIWVSGGGEANPIKPLHHSWCFVRNPWGSSRTQGFIFWCWMRVRMENYIWISLPERNRESPISRYCF